MAGLESLLKNQMFENVPSSGKTFRSFQENQILAHENLAGQEIFLNQEKSFFYICLMLKLSLKDLNKRVSHQVDCNLNNWLDQQVRLVCLKQIKSNL